MLEALPLAVFFKDGRSRWQVVNNHGLRLFRLARLDWQGKTDRDLARMVPALREALETWAADDEKVWQTRARHDSHALIPDALGRLREFEVAKVPLFEVDGTRAGLVEVANDITDASDNVAIAKAIIAMVRRLNLEVIAKGVETEAQLAFQRSNACCLMQGFYFSRPLSADAFGAFLAAHSPTSPADAVI